MGAAESDTIAAVATAPGTGGVGVVRVSGPGVVGIMESLSGRRLEPRVASRIRFVDGDGLPVDDGLGLYFPAPRSYTGEPVFELHGHGGPVVLERLLGLCLALGARRAEPGEFTKRAFLNGKLDLAQAEAVADLIAARTERAARSAARSLTGDFSRLVRGFQEELTELRMLMEACLDFPDEGEDFVTRADVSGRLQALEASVDRALQAGRSGKLLNEGVSVVLVGAPNAGKSSIINMLCGDDVAIVAPHPGTTRDPVKERIQIDGVPIQVVDTAGLRETQNAIEQLGIDRTWRAVETADLALVVLDASGGATLDPEALARVPASIPRLWIHNKIDLVGREPGTTVTGDDTHVWISALTRAGLRELRRSILRLAVGTDLSDSPFAARDHQLDALRSARASIVSARGVLRESELAAEELRSAQLALSSITGEVTADDLLGEIFSRFCIGK